MRLSSYLVAILDLCNLYIRGFSIGVEFQYFKNNLLHTFTNILVKEMFGIYVYFYHFPQYCWTV